MSLIKFRIRITDRVTGNVLELFANLYGDPESLMEFPVDLKKYSVSTIDQFTGLFDNGNNEIYENDIVKCSYGTGKVIFQAGCFMVQWLDDNEAYMEFVFSRKGMYRRKDDEEFVIVGNMHDNPEIIKSFERGQEKI